MRTYHSKKKLDGWRLFAFRLADHHGFIHPDFLLPHLTLRQFTELAEYHSIVGKPGVDHADVPLAVLATAVLNFMSEDASTRPGDLMPHLEEPEQTSDEIWRRIKGTL